MYNIVYQTKCKSCNELSKNFGYTCDMKCSIKGKEKIYPSQFTMRDIANCLENNIGIKISTPNMSIYVREIKQLIEVN